MLLGAVFLTIKFKIMNKIKLFLKQLKKIFTHNHCDTCGFTEDEVFVTEYFTESGYIQCEKCFNKNT